MGAQFIPLGTLPDYSWSIAYGLSGDGQVVAGAAYSKTLGQQAFNWSAQTGLVSLGKLAGLPYSEAFGINADGSEIVGVSDSMTGRIAFRWTQSGGMQTMAGGGSNISPAFGRGVNASTVVGSGLSSQGVAAFAWDPGNRFVTLPGNLGNAEGISADSSQIVGQTTIGSNHKMLGTRWIRKTGTQYELQYLFPLNGYSDANCENIAPDCSVVVGACMGGPYNEATYWDRDNRAYGLGYLTSHGISSVAYGASNEGSKIVGFSMGSKPDTRHYQAAFLWEPLKGMQNLQSLLENLGLSQALKGWHLLVAYGISADGNAIVGWGNNPQDQQEAFYATLS